MKEYIEPMQKSYTSTGTYVNEFQMLSKLNEVINYLNGLIDVGLLPIPDGYKEDESK